MGVDSSWKKMLREVIGYGVFTDDPSDLDYDVIASDWGQKIFAKPESVRSGPELLDFLLMITKPLADGAKSENPSVYLMFDDGRYVPRGKDPCQKHRAQTCKAEMVAQEFKDDPDFNSLPHDWNSIRVDRGYRQDLIAWLRKNVQKRTVDWGQLIVTDFDIGEADCISHMLSVEKVKPGGGILIDSVDSDVIFLELLCAPDRAKEGDFQTRMYLKSSPITMQEPKSTEHVERMKAIVKGNPELLKDFEKVMESTELTMDEVIMKCDVRPQIKVPEYIDMNKLWQAARAYYGGDPIAEEHQHEEDEGEWLPPEDESEHESDFELSSSDDDDDDDDDSSSESSNSQSDDIPEKKQRRKRKREESESQDSDFEPEQKRVRSEDEYNGDCSSSSSESSDDDSSTSTRKRSRDDENDSESSPKRQCLSSDDEEEDEEIYGPVTMRALPDAKYPNWTESLVSVVLLSGSDFVKGWNSEKQVFCNPIPGVGAQYLYETWQEISKKIGPLAVLLPDRKIDMQWKALWTLVRMVLTRKLKTKFDTQLDKLPPYWLLCEKERLYKRQNYLPSVHGMVLTFVAVRYQLHYWLNGWRGYDKLRPSDEVHPESKRPMHPWVHNSETGKCERCSEEQLVHDEETIAHWANQDLPLPKEI